MCVCFFISEKSILTKKSQNNKLICVFVFVVVISRCKIDFYFFIFYDWVRLGHSFRLGPEVARRGPWGSTEWVWG